MERYVITGMSCAACSARVEKAVSRVPGVTSCAVSLLTNSMGVEGTASDREIIAAVQKAGYGAERLRRGALKAGSMRMSEGRKPMNGGEALLADHETPLLRRRLGASLFFLLFLMYLSMGHMMWGFKLPAFLEGNYVAIGMLQMLLTIVIMVINRKFFVSGTKSLLHGAPNMDTLVALGAGAAFVYSTAALFVMTDAQLKGDANAVLSYMHELYFESAGMILTLITVGKLLEARSKGKTTDALKGLMRLTPKTAVIVTPEGEREVPVEQVKKQDVFVVRPGENIPVDGVVLEGSSAVNEAALTGESIPVDKAAGDTVSAATINQSGFLRCRASRVGEDTTLSQIIRMISDAAATKAPIAKVADRVSGVFVPVVISIAAVAVLVWVLAGAGIGYALARGISVLVISCPCALGLATPVAIMVGNGQGARNGILFKTAASLEETGRVSIVALDKTGTITCGQPSVTDLVAAEGSSEEELLRIAYALERMSEHPLAGAVREYAEKAQLTPLPLTGFSVEPGNGLTGCYEGTLLVGGNARFVEGKAEISEQMQSRAKLFSEEGKTPLFFAAGGRLVGVIAVADVIKEDSPRAIRQLKQMGIRVVMLTGDNEFTANAIGRQAGVDQVIAGVLPDGKESVIRRLSEEGKVAMVGDGMNDAPALTRAAVGIAIGAGTDIAIDAADVVLMKSRLSDVPAAIRLSRATLRNIHENLFWAFIYNVIGIPLAAGVWIPLLHWQLNPMFGAAAMSLSSFCVVTNALRLNFVDIHGERSPKKRESEEEKRMQRTMKIEGMMCGHCEARVKKCLEALPEVEKAEVSHEKKTAVVTLLGQISDEVLKKTVEDQDYTVTGIE